MKGSTVFAFLIMVGQVGSVILLSWHHKRIEKAYRKRVSELEVEKFNSDVEATRAICRAEFYRGSRDQLRETLAEIERIEQQIKDLEYDPVYVNQRQLREG